MVAISRVLEQRGRIVVAIDNNVHKAIAVNVTESDTARGLRMTEHVAAPGRHINEPAGNVSKQKRRLQIMRVRLGHLNVVHDMALADEQVFEAIVIVVDELRAPS